LLSKRTFGSRKKQRSSRRFDQVYRAARPSSVLGAWARRSAREQEQAHEERARVDAPKLEVLRRADDLASFSTWYKPANERPDVRLLVALGHPERRLVDVDDEVAPSLSIRSAETTRRAALRRPRQPKRRAEKRMAPRAPAAPRRERVAESVTGSPSAQVSAAITQPNLTELYFFGTRGAINGARIEYKAGPALLVDGEVL
jgi:hypothetical protein